MFRHADKNTNVVYVVDLSLQDISAVDVQARLQVHTSALPRTGSACNSGTNLSGYNQLHQMLGVICWAVRGENLHTVQQVRKNLRGSNNGRHKIIGENIGMVRAAKGSPQVRLVKLGQRGREMQYLPLSQAVLGLSIAFSCGVCPDLMWCFLQLSAVRPLFIFREREAKIPSNLATNALVAQPSRLRTSPQQP